MNLRARLTGLLAAAFMVGFLVGMPWVLLAVGGNPIPAGLPSVDQLRDWLTSPDDGTLALAAIRALGWAVWLFLAGTLLLEIGAQIRGVQTPRLPGLRRPQFAARRLVATAALLFIAVPAAASLSSIPAAAQPVTLTPGASAATPVSPTVARTTNHLAVRRSAFVDHVVKPSDTLAGLADTYLDDPERWPEIFAASRHVVQPDGRHLSDPDLIVDGWTLKIPTTATHMTDAVVSVPHLVVAGDTLSELAATHLGDEGRWPEIFDASQHVTQPGGRHLSDPDLILEGWTLQIPSTDQPAGTLATEVVESSTRTPAHTRVVAPTTTNPPVALSAASHVDLMTPHDPDASRDASEEEVPVSVTQPAAHLDATWLLTGLSVGGAVLAGSALLVWRRRRELQFRSRRSGRAIATPEPILAPVQKTLSMVGSVSAPTVEFMDAALRRLARSQTRLDRPMPDLAAVQLTRDAVVLHLASAAELAEPWVADDAVPMRWRLRHDTGIIDTDDVAAEQAAPYPLLVTSGSSDSGDLWLLNLEHFGCLQLVGDDTYADDFVRYLTAELAVNPWSRAVRISCPPIADSVRPMNPSRFRPAGSLDEATLEALTAAEATVERAGRVHADAVTGRSRQLAGEAWAAKVVIVDAESCESLGIQRLAAFVQSERGLTSTAVVINGESGEWPGAELEFTATGRVRLPHAGLDLVAVGLTADEAAGCAAVLAQSEAADDVLMPATSDATEGWRSVSDDAGALRPELMAPFAVDDDAEETSSKPDDHGARSEPGTASELENPALAVPHDVRAAVAQVDPGLDQDVRDWFADRCLRPRLALLGPVSVRAHGVPIAKRKPFFTEVLAYIALREHGATPEELADAFGHTTATARSSVTIVRDWLGTNPRSGQRYLPDADKSRAAQARGVAVYQVEDLLIDVDLFRRLRLRGQARGVDGIDDLVAALRLVTGRPFDQRRPDGWSWLVDLNIDNHMVCAIVDVAHLLTLHFLQSGDLPKARAATETAILAAPYDAIPRLDLAAVTKAEGHVDEARRIVREQVCNVPDEDGLPMDLGARVEEILAGLDWFNDPFAALLT